MHMIAHACPKYEVRTRENAPECSHNLGKKFEGMRRGLACDLRDELLQEARSIARSLRNMGYIWAIMVVSQNYEYILGLHVRIRVFWYRYWGPPILQNRDILTIGALFRLQELGNQMEKTLGISSEWKLGLGL